MTEPLIERTPTPRAELMALHRETMTRGRYDIELMLLGVYYRATHRRTRRVITIKRMGSRWCVWVDGRDMVKVRSGELAEAFKDARGRASVRRVDTP